MTNNELNQLYELLRVSAKLVGYTVELEQDCESTFATDVLRDVVNDLHEPLIAAANELRRLASDLIDNG